jgi:hypothetical protein
LNREAFVAVQAGSAHAERGTDAAERIDHKSDQRAIAQPVCA